MDDLSLMRIRADTLFTYDDRGRMIHSNEPDWHPAPLVLLGWSPTGGVIRFAQAVPDDLARTLREIVERQPPNGDIRIPEGLLHDIRAVLKEHAPVAEEGGPAYRFPGTIPTPDGVIQLTLSNVELARDTIPWLPSEIEGWWPCFAVVRDGAAVAVCFSSRIGAEVCEAGVNTLPAYRGRGYAAAVTAAWGAAILASGRIPLYSTSWQNAASQGVARRVGLIMFSTDASWRKCVP